MSTEQVPKLISPNPCNPVKTSNLGAGFQSNHNNLDATCYMLHLPTKPFPRNEIPRSEVSSTDEEVAKNSHPLAADRSFYSKGEKQDANCSVSSDRQSRGSWRNATPHSVS